jgi:hypothetical protein
MDSGQSSCAASGDQAHAVAVALDAEAIAFVLDLAESVRAARNDGGLGGDAELKRLKHGPKTGVRADFANPLSHKKRDSLT